LAIRRCQRASAARLSASVIGPLLETATTTKGASQPGPIESAISSASWRAELDVGSCSALGGPVFSERAGAASSITTTPIRITATSGRLSAPRTSVITPAPSPSPPIRQRLTLWPVTTSSAGPTRVATMTLIPVTTIAVPASEISSVPGITNSVTSIAKKRVEPANAVVRPAVRRVIRAASSGAVPASSSSRKRETIKRA
jgi:hypothetical protein